MIYGYPLICHSYLTSGRFLWQESSAGEVARTGGEPHDWAGDASDPPKALVRPRSEGINQRRSTQLGDVSMLDDGLEFKKEIRTIFFSLPPSGSVDPP